VKVENLGLGGIVAIAAAWIGWDWYQAYHPSGQVGGAKRHLNTYAVRDAALDASAGMITPDHLIHFGPTARPPDWGPHRVRYPATPGQELERLMYGAPGACVTPAVPRALRGWMFEPPSEVDY